MTSSGGAHQRGRGRAVAASRRVYRALMRVYPQDIRERYGEEMVGCFSDACRDEVRRSGPKGLAAVWLRALPDLIFTALKERSNMLARNAYRSAVAVALAAAFILAWIDLSINNFEEPDFASWMAPIGFFAVPVIGAVIAYKATKTRGTAYRAAVGVAFAIAFLLAWVNLAVGVIGDSGDPANLMYVGVFAVGVIGAVIARFRPHGMARALVATALAQTLVAMIALILGLGYPWSPPAEILGVNGFFVSLFVGSALLFRYAAREQTPAGAGPED